MKQTYTIAQLRPYINWLYFYHAWGIGQQPQAEKQRLRTEAEERLNDYENRYSVHALFELFNARSAGDDILVSRQSTVTNESPGGPPRHEACISCLRQQQQDSQHLCLSDFIAPSFQHSSPNSQIGVFATSADIGLETDFDSDPYEKMMAQLLADRLAEAAAELLHLEVRTRHWGYAPHEHLSIADLHVERFQGIRPAVGYPSLPDVSLNFVLDRLLGGFNQIGIRLTESGAMKPHASVSGLMIAHAKARYFNIGKIGEDQLRDYANRRGLPTETVRKFLTANL